LNVGFQLSFLAVLSIVIFHPFIHSFFYFKNKILDSSWSLVAVSIAAQVGTLPLTLYYFNQFPNYFILTNLIAIPLATVILYLAVVLLIVSPLSFVSIWIGKITDGLLLLLNLGLGWIENIPFSRISSIQFSLLQSVLLVGGIVLVSIFLFTKRHKVLQLSMLVLASVFVLNFINKFSVCRNELVVFNVPKRSVLCLKINGEANFFHCDTCSVDLVKDCNFYIGGYISKSTFRGKYQILNLNHNISNLNMRIAKSRGLATIATDNYLIAFPYCDSVKYIQNDYKLNVDLLVINRNFTSNILDLIQPSMAIIDGSLPLKQHKAVLAMLASHNIKSYVLNANGAYTTILK
jgi:hypothetical protein